MNLTFDPALAKNFLLGVFYNRDLILFGLIVKANGDLPGQVVRE